MCVDVVFGKEELTRANGFIAHFIVNRTIGPGQPPAYLANFCTAECIEYISYVMAYPIFSPIFIDVHRCANSVFLKLK